jgi:hypothetical protein
VGRVPGQQDPAALVRLGLAGVVGPAGGGPVQRGHGDVGAGDPPDAGLDLGRGDRGAPVGGRRGELDGQDPAGDRAVAVDAGRGPGPAGVQSPGAVQVGDGLVAGDLRVGAGEADPGQLADRAAAAVGADHVAGGDRARRSVQGDGVTVLAEPGHLDAAADRDAEAGRVPGQDGFHVALRDHGAAGDRVLVLGGLRLGEAGDLPHHLLLGPPGRRQQATPVQDLGGGHVDRARLDRRLGLGQAVDDLHGHPAQSQLRHDQQAGRARSHHHDVHVSLVSHAFHFTELS